MSDTEKDKGSSLEEKLLQVDAWMMLQARRKTENVLPYRFCKDALRATAKSSGKSNEIRHQSKECDWWKIFEYVNSVFCPLKVYEKERKHQITVRK